MMWHDVVDLREFYETRRGQVARHMVRRAVRSVWPEVRGQRVLGLGFASPYLRQFMGEAERVLAFMPASQGVMHWPPEGAGLVSLVEETDLPLPRSDEPTSELQSLMRISSDVFCLKKKTDK